MTRLTVFAVDNEPVQVELRESGPTEQCYIPCDFIITAQNQVSLMMWTSENQLGVLIEAQGGHTVPGVLAMTSLFICNV